MSDVVHNDTAPSEGPSLAWSHGCPEPMTWKGTGTGWDGEYELTTVRYACPSCPSTAEIVSRQHVGPPAGIQ